MLFLKADNDRPTLTLFLTKTLKKMIDKLREEAIDFAKKTVTSLFSQIPGLGLALTILTMKRTNHCDFQKVAGSKFRPLDIQENNHYIKCQTPDKKYQLYTTFMADEMTYVEGNYYTLYGEFQKMFPDLNCVTIIYKLEPKNDNLKRLQERTV